LLENDLTTEQALGLIFRAPSVRHGLAEFDGLGKKPHDILSIFPRTIESGRNKGEVRYYLKCLKRNEDIQVLAEKKCCPEEIVRQLWLYKLHHIYKTSTSIPSLILRSSIKLNLVRSRLKKPQISLSFKRTGRQPRSFWRSNGPNAKKGSINLRAI